MTADLPWTNPTPNGVSINVNLEVYSREVVLRTCHAFTARCYAFARADENGTITIELAPRDARDSVAELAGEFSNALLDYQLRAIIASETKTIRELLVAQAFCEADLLDRRDSESDEYTDPRGIAG